jgi:quinol monooxygenase YgiN
MTKEYAMPEIRLGNKLVTHITAIEVDPLRQPELIALMSERARFMATQPGFVSLSLHCSTDKRHIVNYGRWSDNAEFEAAYRAPGFHALQCADPERRTGLL